MSMRIILLGAQGSGKGTQAAVLKEKLGLPHISTGDILREKVAAGSPNGLKAKAYMDKGELVPSDIVLGIIQERLAEPDCAEGCIFDGYPRSEEQSKALEKISVIDKVLYLKLDEDILIKRLKGRRTCNNKACNAIYNIESFSGEDCPKCGTGKLRQRGDDKEEATIRTRLEVFKNETEPLIDYYRGKGLLVTIDAAQSPQNVTEQILAALKK